MPQPGDVLIVHAHPTGPFGEPVTRKGRDNDVKAGTVDAMGMWIGHEWHERKQLTNVLGQPWVKISGTPCPCRARSWTKWMCTPSSPGRN